MRTKYGDINNNTTWFYIDNITGSTFKILPIFEESTFEKYNIYINDFINELMAYDNIMDSKYFFKLILNLEALKNPKPNENESVHKYVRRKVFECRDLAEKIILEIKDNVRSDSDGL